MFDKILIANRGEIACRIARTARSLGVATVGVFSEADAGALHVRLVDEAVLIGPAPVRESYLDGDRIIEAARRTGSEAVHPGYGFLSENADFAEACARAGLTFVGPPASAIRAMGSKAASKALMASAGIPLTPGYHGEDQDPALLAAEAEAIGYPVLIKASAGGGGKGMRRVDAPADFLAALASCKREALSAFGDGRVLLERYVVQPRHIEIQVFADAHGGCVHLFERDCSVQRRHQKVLEEAPAPGMTPERRAEMGRAAVEAARAVGYVGAGTVEFISSQGGEFFFMEMNTRLQVEHPVTEMVTGLDLVEWQLRVASGEPLPLTQEQVRLTGHAVEARIYAEDPDRGFLPSTGRITHLDAPRPADGIRLDTGVEQGDAVTSFYDPMLAKLIAWGSDRPQALARLRRALERYSVVGVSTNLDFLVRLVATSSFAEARLDTGLIEREAPALFPEPENPPDAIWALVALAEVLRERRDAVVRANAAIEPHSPWNATDGWRTDGRSARRLRFRSGEAEREILVEVVDDGFDISDGTSRVRGTGRLTPDGELQAQLGDHRIRSAVVRTGDKRTAFLNGRAWTVALVSASGPEDDDRGNDADLRAPMPGVVTVLSGDPGTVVDKGTPLLVIEAMKVEHTIRAPARGTIKAYCCEVGDLVAEGADLIDFERTP